MMLPQRSTRARLRAGCAALLAAWSWSGATAAENILPPGFQVGPMFVAPSLVAGLFVDSNPFLRSSASVLPGEQLEDIVARVNPAIVATLPFRNSWFRFAYDGVFRRYRDSTTSENNSQDVLVELSMLFSTFDRWTIRADRSWGAADVIRFDGGEAVSDGTPFTFATYETVVERDVPGRRGYAANLRYSQLTFDSTSYAFFNYDGPEGSAELREALNPHLWFVAGAAFRRFDHRLANDPTHSVYRQERTDALLAGVQGLTPSGQSWRAVLRYDRARYPGASSGSDYSGLGGDVYVFLAPGPTSTVSFYASRRSWSSFYLDNNYYVANVVGCRAEKRWMNNTSIGLDVYGSLTDYPEATFDPLANTSVSRRDHLVWGQLYANLAIGAFYAFRFSYVHQSRNSNVEGVDYRGDAFGVQFVLGVR